MFISIDFFLMSMPLFLGAYKIITSQVNESLQKAASIYGSFFISMALFTFLLGVANVSAFHFSPDTIRILQLVAIFLVLYIGLGIVDVFTFWLGGKGVVGIIVLLAHVLTAFYMFNIHIAEYAQMILLSAGDPMFAYWRPAYKPMSLIVSLGLVLFAAGVYSWYLLRTASATESAFIRKKSITLALGSVLASLGGAVYFLSLFLRDEIIPTVTAYGLILAVIGFNMLVAPLFMKSPKTPNQNPV